MTTTQPWQNASGAAQVTCPFCLHEFSWDGKSSLFTRDEKNDYQPLDISTITNPARLNERLRRAYVRCPNPKEDPPEETPPDHYLPIDYMRHRKPLVIGFIGAVESGKSTLLAMMIDQLDKQRLLSYGFTSQPLVQEDHERFRAQKLDPLVKRGEALARTRASQESAIEFADGFLLIHGDDVRQPVVFFDVGGEALGDVGSARSVASNRATRFLQAVGALIFVVDALPLIGRDDSNTDIMGRPIGDDTFRRVVGDIRGAAEHPTQYLEIPAAIVLGKADLVRLDPVIARWLNADDHGGAVDPVQIRAESRDVYAFLHQHQGESWLLPFDRFRRCTLHVVSATGTTASNQRYSRVRTRRVLQPLIAILAMTHVLDTPGATEVGQ